LIVSSFLSTRYVYEQTLFAFSKNVLFSALDDLLDSIGIKLQISKTAHKRARSKYHTIAEWLKKGICGKSDIEPVLIF